MDGETRGRSVPQQQSSAIMTHAEIEARYGIKPGELCESCNVPMTADEITKGETTVTDGGGVYHTDCIESEIPDIPEDSAQIALDHARRTEGW